MSWVDDLNNRPDAMSYDQFFKRSTIDSLARQRKATTTKDSSNSLAGWLPTIGGTAGGIGGGALGGALAGTAVLPGVGTAVGGLIGAILGGAGGSALGKVGENAIEGNKDLGEGVGGEALMGGLTSIPVTSGFKLLGAGTKALTGVGKKSATQLVEEAGQKAIPSFAQKTATDVAPNQATKFGQGLANRTYAQAFTAPRRVADQLRPQQTAQELMNYGVSGSLDKIQNTSKNAVSELGSLLNKSVGHVGGEIPVGDVTGVADRALRGVKVTGADRRALSENLTDIGTKGTLPGYSQPFDILDSIRTLEGRGYKKINAGESSLVQNPDMADLGRAYTLAADEMKDNLFNAVDKAGGLKAVQTPENAARLNQIANGLGDKFMQAKSASELRSLMAPFVRAGHLADVTNDQAQSVMTQSLNRGGIMGLIQNPISIGVQEAVRAPLATKAGLAMNKVSNALTRGGTSSGGQGIIGALTRQTGGRVLTGTSPLQNEAQAQQVDELGLTPQDYDAYSQAVQAQGLDPSVSPFDQATDSTAATGDSPQQPTNPFGVSLEDVAGQMRQALQNGDIKGYQALGDIYDRITQWEKNNQTASGKLNSTTSTSLASSANAINTLSQLEQLYQSAGGGSGRLGGGIANLLAGAGLDGNTQSYNDLSASSVSQLARALNGGGQVSDADAAVVIQALPKVTDSPEVAAQKFAALKQRLQTAQQNTYNYGSAGSASDILSALGYSQ